MRITSASFCFFFMLYSCCVYGVQHARTTRQITQSLLHQVQQILITTRQENGSMDLSLLLREYMDDPLAVPNFNITDSGSTVSVEGWFWNARISGLKAVNVKQIRLNLAHMHFTADVYFPLLRLDSEYELEGSMLLFTISGNGNMWMNVSDLFLQGSIFLRQVPSTGQLRVESIDIDVKKRDITVHFENLGGAWSGVINAVLHELRNLVFEHIKTSLIRDLKRNLKVELDRRLSEIPREPGHPRTTNVIDDLILRVADAFQYMDLEPMYLKDHTESFTKNLIFITANGSLKISNGVLHGLSTLHRTGDIIIVYNNTGISIEATLGFSNLTGGYNWTARFMESSLSGYSSVLVRSISATLVLHQNVTAQSKLYVSELKVDRIRQIWVDIDGLGAWDFVLEIIVNLVTNSLKLTLANAITHRVKDTIQNQLDNFGISLF